MDSKKPISFAREVKEEIARGEYSDEQKRSRLSALAKISGGLRLSGREETLDISTDVAAVAKAIYRDLVDLYGANARFAYTRGVGARARIKYHVLVEDPRLILGDLEVDFLTDKIPHNAVANDSLSAGYLAGAFLAAGSVNDPKNANYHLEIALGKEAYAKWLQKLINRVNGHHFNAKVAPRRKQWVVYLKRSDEISDFLILIGAKQSCLKFENAKIDRDFANVDNRLQNLDEANFGKTQEAASRQLMEIRFFAERGYQDITSPKLRILMGLRLAHEDATLEELAELLSEEIASTVSKSNVNHLFRKLHALYLEHHG